MSFRIFAVGSTGTGHSYHYNRTGLDIGDVYDMGSALGDIASVPSAYGPAREGLRAGATAAGGEAIGDAGDVFFGPSAHQRAMEALGHITGAHLFADALTMFLAEHSPLALFIGVRWDGFFSESACVSLRLFSSEEYPVDRALRQIHPVLEEGELNGFGVLSRLARILTEYGIVAGRRRRDGDYRLNIDITAT